MRIEDYALIGDTQTAALVARDGSIDWLCLPRFDSGACFAALLGDRSHGRWKIAPCDPNAAVERRYRRGTLVLETTFRTEDGTVRLVDYMPPRGEAPDVVRIGEGVQGRVSMEMDLVVRFDYGSVVPWVRRIDGTRSIVAGPDALEFRSSVPVHGEDRSTKATFSVGAGDQASFVLTWHPSNAPPPDPIAPVEELEHTCSWWRAWSDRCAPDGRWHDAVVRSMITLKALTYAPTGGIVAAPTTSLPEVIGGTRNWDYRYCWLRDATFTLEALLHGGYDAEARAWRDWLLRAVAGNASQLQIMYGVAGERRLPELELEWLPGFDGSAPVRIGNAASRQLQLDVYGEVMDTLHQSRLAGIASESNSWDMQRALLDWLESGWRNADHGLWEIRSGARHYTHSKVMCWVAFDRAVHAVERFHLDGPVERWRALREEIHREVCENAWDAHGRTFTQSYGSTALDAALLMIPLVGFLPVDDPRVAGTIAAVRRDLTEDGFVHRYGVETNDALPGREGAFLLCSFWLADVLTLAGDTRASTTMVDRLIGIANDVGLLAEEYDSATGRMLGNFPQAFSHVGLVNSALNLARTGGPTESRRNA